ncbi:MAG: metal ABC transporter ATP-binding protein [Chloroflexi bacterium]|nr:metal ABC transporter ATP-binding protein [Chloroflexota bacterium]
MVELAPSAPGHRPPPHPDGEPLVELSDLSTGYERTPVLRNVDFTLRRGEFAGVVGPSGSGKTTLLRAIAGQTRRFAGAIKATPRAGERALRLGYVPQVEAINWNFPLTVGQAVLLGRWREMGWRPWPRRHDRELLANILDRLGIGHLANRQIRALSGGQQQRTFLARALIGDPDLLLLDEPTSGVDIKTRHEIMHLLGELNRAGTTILMSTHDLNAVATHLPRLVCVGEGALIADGSPEDVLTPEVLRRTYGAEMLVLRRGDAIYVVEHLDDAMTGESEETPLPATPVGG